MPINIIEFKARVKDSANLEALLKGLNPVFKGEDRQIDTYFYVKDGRLKLREGQVENALIWYDRPDEKGSKLSQVLLYKHTQDAALKAILTKLHGIIVIVDKLRRIYFIENVKFHFDYVQELGYFIEVEAIDESGNIGLETLQKQCDYYAELLGVQQSDFIAVSYSDMIIHLQVNSERGK